MMGEILVIVSASTHIVRQYQGSIYVSVNTINMLPCTQKKCDIYTHGV